MDLHLYRPTKLLSEIQTPPERAKCPSHHPRFHRHVNIL
jgi:hypothetical protein